MRLLTALLLLTVTGNCLAQTLKPGEFLAFKHLDNYFTDFFDPYSIGEGNEGRVWFADWRHTQVGYIGADDTITAFKLTDPSDPLNLVRPLMIIEGPDANAWFTYYITNNSGSPLNRSGVGRVTQGGAATLFPFASGNACRQSGVGGGGPPDCGIAVGLSSYLYLVQTQIDQLARVSLDGQITEIPIPRISGGYELTHIAAGSDGNLMMPDLFADRVVRRTPTGSVSATPTCRGPYSIEAMAEDYWMTCLPGIMQVKSTGATTLYPMSSLTAGRIAARPGGIAAGPDTRLWYTLPTNLSDGSPGPSEVGRLDPTTGNREQVEIPIAGSARHIVFRRETSLGMEFVMNVAGPNGIHSLLSVTKSLEGEPPRLRISKEPRAGKAQVNGATEFATRVNARVTFRIAVSNPGPGSVADVVVEDVPGPGLADCKMLSGPGYTVESGTLRARFSLLAASTEVEYPVFVECTAVFSGVLTSVATARATGVTEQRATTRIYAFDPRRADPVIDDPLSEIR